MAHRYNQRVFSSVDLNSGLLYSYLRLVSIELALKGHNAGNWTLSHNLELMISGLGVPALTPLVNQLKLSLKALWCEGKGGGPKQVDPSNYPAIRYLRHDSDFVGSADCSSDADLAKLRASIDDLANELKRQKVLP